MMSEDSSAFNNINADPLATTKKFSISTRYGYVIVTQQGPTDRPVIVTYHDIGYNSDSQYHWFFCTPEMAPITSRFTVYHINAPGQEDQATQLPATFVYPTLEQLTDSIHDVFEFLSIKSAVCLGIGLGANLLVRFALKHPSKVNGLILINCVLRAAGLLEGLSLKWPHVDDTQTHLTSSLLHYLIHHNLGAQSQSKKPDLLETIRDHLENNINARNVLKLLHSYLKRSHIHLESGNKVVDSSKTLHCHVLNLTGSYSPHKTDVIEMNDHCDSSKSTYVEFSDCGGAVIQEQPAKTAESIQLFLQGLGYISHLSIPKYSVSNRLYEQVTKYKQQHGAFCKVPHQLSTHVSTEEQPLTNPHDELDDFEEDLDYFK